MCAIADYCSYNFGLQMYIYIVAVSVKGLHLRVLKTNPISKPSVTSITIKTPPGTSAEWHMSILYSIRVLGGFAPAFASNPNALSTLLFQTPGASRHFVREYPRHQWTWTDGHHHRAIARSNTLSLSYCAYIVYMAPTRRITAPFPPADHATKATYTRRR